LTVCRTRDTVRSDTAIPSLSEFAVNSGCTPQRVRFC
jgi:hypothetical protein